jgi:Domain of unknown function (DUF4192)
LSRLQALADSLLGELEHSEDHRPAARLMGSLIDSATSDPGVLDEGTCVLLALLVSEGHIRDLAWALLSPTNAEEHVRLWAGVVAHVPPTLAAAPLCLLGMAAWVYGSGALLNCCCERVAQVDPSYSMGRLLWEISARAVPPSLWQQMGEQMQAGRRAEVTSLAG